MKSILQVKYVILVSSLATNFVDDKITYFQKLEDQFHLFKSIRTRTDIDWK